MFEKTIKLTTQFVWPVVVLVVFGMALPELKTYLSLEKQRVVSAAVDSCFKSAEVKTTRTVAAEQKDLLITEPVREIYTYCLRDKGIEPSK